MIRTGKCPKCDVQLPSVKIEAIEVKEGTHSAWHGVSYLCPYCRAILGVGIDPIAIKTDIVKELTKVIRSGR